MRVLFDVPRRTANPAIRENESRAAEGYAPYDEKSDPLTMVSDHAHDVSDGPCNFCLQSPAVAPRIRTRSEVSKELLVRQAHGRLALWLRGERGNEDHLDWAIAFLGEAVFSET